MVANSNGLTEGARSSDFPAAFRRARSVHDHPPLMARSIMRHRLAPAGYIAEIRAVTPRLGSTRYNGVARIDGLRTFLFRVDGAGRRSLSLPELGSLAVWPKMR